MEAHYRPQCTDKKEMDEPNKSMKGRITHVPTGMATQNCIDRESNPELGQRDINIHNGKTQCYRYTINAFLLRRKNTLVPLSREDCFHCLGIGTR